MPSIFHLFHFICFFGINDLLSLFLAFHRPFGIVLYLIMTTLLPDYASLNCGLQGTRKIEMMSEENAYKWHTG